MLALCLDTCLDLARSDARFGAGLFETIRICRNQADHGQAWHLSWHLERMQAGCDFFGMAKVPPLAQVEDFLNAHGLYLFRGDRLDALFNSQITNDSGEARPPLHLSHAARAPVRYAHRDGASPLTPAKKASKACLFGHGVADTSGVLRLLALDGKLFCWSMPLDASSGGNVEIGISRQITRYSKSALNRFKTLSYLENVQLQREAASSGFFDVIALNERGCLTDGGRCSLFVLLEDGLFTPPVSDGALPGIGRRSLLEAGLGMEKSLFPADLGRCRGLFMVNALRGLVAVSRLDGRELPALEEGLLRRLRAELM